MIAALAQGAIRSCSLPFSVCLLNKVPKVPILSLGAAPSRALILGKELSLAISPGNFYRPPLTESLCLADTFPPALFQGSPTSAPGAQAAGSFPVGGCPVHWGVSGVSGSVPGLQPLVPVIPRPAVTGHPSPDIAGYGGVRATPCRGSAALSVEPKVLGRGGPSLLPKTPACPLTLQRPFQPL